MALRQKVRNAGSLLLTYVLATIEQVQAQIRICSLAPSGLRYTRPPAIKNGDAALLPRKPIRNGAQPGRTGA